MSVDRSPDEVARMAALQFSIRFLDLHRAYLRSGFFGITRYVAQGAMVRLDQYMRAAYPPKKKKATSRKKQPQP